MFIEIIGHNYLSYYETPKAVPSINFSYRFPIVPSKVNSNLSVGLGTFSEEHYVQIPWQPSEYKREYTVFIPLGLSLQVGEERNFLEFGGAIAFAWGQHWIGYTGSQGSGTTIALDKGVQYSMRIGYAFYGMEGIFFRIALTPHFYSSSLRTHQQMSIYKDPWIPMGLSFGYSF